MEKIFECEIKMVSGEVYFINDTANVNEYVDYVGIQQGINHFVKKFTASSYLVVESSNEKAKIINCSNIESFTVKTIGNFGEELEELEDLF